MKHKQVPFWKEAPFFRLIIPLTSGIWLQYYLHWPITAYWSILSACIAGLSLFAVLRSVMQFRHYWVTGLSINLLLLCLGGISVLKKDIGNEVMKQIDYAAPLSIYIAIINQPIEAGQNSFKTTASFEYLLNGEGRKRIKGNCLLYFDKNSSRPVINYKSRIAFIKKPQEIKNNGNPGAFDFRQYCGFKNIFHQVFLRPGDYVIYGGESESDIYSWLFRVRTVITSILRKYIPGKIEAGLGEALLIGYKADLDKELVRSYSNTGVVHVIAISGLHVGLIYGLLSAVFAFIPHRRPIRFIKPVCIVCGLWLFGILAGAGPSVMRSVLMFSFLVLGSQLGKQAAVLNSLFASAFLLLCYDPFLLWDAGFQLSYVAVAGILFFTKAIYSCLYVRNKALDMIWKMVAVCLAAQWFTTPVSIYHFHQFPIYFLITNLVAVPLSGLIVMMEILLCALSPLPLLADLTGRIVYHLIVLMNLAVAHMESMPFGVADGLLISSAELVLAYLLVGAASLWLMFRNSRAAVVSLCACTCLYAIQVRELYAAANQLRFIVYNVPRHRAFDMIKGQYYLFSGDSGITADRRLQNIYLEPTRTLFRLKDAKPTIARPVSEDCFYFSGTRILVVSEPPWVNSLAEPLETDIVIISGSPELRITELLRAVHCRQIIFDSSNASRKVRQWRSECAGAGLQAHAVAENGAFVMNLND